MDSVPEAVHIFKGVRVVGEEVGPVYEDWKEESLYDPVP